jgi:WD40 repeat protein
VRDVKFNPSGSCDFIACFENGSIQTWDYRYSSRHEQLWNAHSGLCLTIDWNADTGLVASGGRDKSIKLWDTKSSSRKPTQVIHTIAPVSRVKWRPGSSNEIASCSLSLDSRIQIWDISHPFVAKHILADYDESDRTAILWDDDSVIWSCSKDSTLTQHHITDSYSPEKLLNIYPMSWSHDGDFALSSKGYCGTISTEVFDKQTFTILAKCYILDQTDIVKSCDHNSKVKVY